MQSAVVVPLLYALTRVSLHLSVHVQTVNNSSSQFASWYLGFSVQQTPLLPNRFPLVTCFFVHRAVENVRGARLDKFLTVHYDHYSVFPVERNMFEDARTGQNA